MIIEVGEQYFAESKTIMPDVTWVYLIVYSIETSQGMAFLGVKIDQETNEVYCASPASTWFDENGDAIEYYGIDDMKLYKRKAAEKVVAGVIDNA